MGHASVNRLYHRACARLIVTVPSGECDMHVTDVTEVWFKCCSYLGASLAWHAPTKRWPLHDAGRMLDATLAWPTLPLVGDMTQNKPWHAPPQPTW
jgi:hypothetical protein